MATNVQDKINELPENLAELLMAADLFQLARLKYATLSTQQEAAAALTVI